MKRTILALAALLVCMAGAQNMLMDAAFTPEGGTDGLPRGWLRQFGAGASCALDGAVRRAGPASLRGADDIFGAARCLRRCCAVDVGVLRSMLGAVFLDLV